MTTTRTDRVVTKNWRHNGRRIQPGTELSIVGQRASRFRFVEHVKLEDGREYITVVGGKKTPKGLVELTRAFRVDQIRTVHIKTRRERGRA